VLAAVEELGYRPNRLARALSTGRTRTIGVVSADTVTLGTAAIRRGIDEAARRAGFVVATASVEPATPARIAAATASLVDHGVEGVIVTVAPAGPEVTTGHFRPMVTTEHSVPMVTVDHSRPDATPVGVDQVAAGRLATEHLLDLGHATVWHLAGPVDSAVARQRADGWRAALGDARRRPPPVRHGDWTPEAGYHHGVGLAAASRADELTAVFVANDEMAFGVLRALAERGRRVPADVAVVGADDIVLAAYAVPPLTTVRLPFTAVGEAAVRALLLGDGAPVVYAPELVVRQSCGARH
jgi:DNA-binding LacI/PurR family transcriptional regulator